jgi:type II secretory pathway component PulC
MMRLCPLVMLIAACATTPSRPPAEPDPTEEAPATDPTQGRAKEAAPDLKEPARAPGTISRRELIAVLDAAPGRFLQHVQTEPRFVGGHFRGWRLASFYPGDARFAGVDIHAGDVIVSVNGHTIEQPEQLMEVWEALRFDKALVIVLEREGQARQLRFDIRD